MDLKQSMFLAAAMTCASAGAVQAQNLVVNGGFETPALTTQWARRLPGTTFGGWLVDNVGAGIAHVGSFGSPLAVEGAQSVELNYLQPGGVSQTLSTVPGRAYVLSFLMAGQINQGPDVKEVRVDWGGAAVSTVSWSRAGTGGAWVPHQFVLTASAATTALHFLGVTPAASDGGPYIDDVRVVPCIDIITEPAAAATCLSGPASLSITAAGVGTVAYQWRKGGTNLGDEPNHIAGAQSPTLILVNTTDADAGSYDCVVSNGCGSLTSQPATLWVGPTCDYNMDGGADNSDISDLANDIASGTETYPPCTTDYNQDGGGDNTDISDLADAIAAGTCP